MMSNFCVQIINIAMWLHHYTKHMITSRIKQVTLTFHITGRKRGHSEALCNTVDEIHAKVLASIQIGTTHSFPKFVPAINLCSSFHPLTYGKVSCPNLPPVGQVLS